MDDSTAVDLDTAFELAPGYRIKFNGDIKPGATHLLIAANPRAAQIVYECRRPGVLTTFHLPMHDGSTDKQSAIRYMDLVERMPFANFAVREEFFTDFGGAENGVNGHLLTARGVDDLVLFKVPHGTARLISYAAKTTFTGTLHERPANARPMLRTTYTPDVKSDPSNASLNIVGRLYDYLYNRRFRFIEKHITKREAKRLELPDGYSEFIVIGPDDFRYANAIKANDIAVRMRELHADPVWVRGHMRTYRHERYVNVQGDSQFIESHKRGEGEPEHRDYLVGGATAEKETIMLAQTTADGKPLFHGQVVADKRPEVLAHFQRNPKRTLQLEAVMADLGITRPQVQWACESLASDGSLERVRVHGYRLASAPVLSLVPPLAPEPEPEPEPVAAIEPQPESSQPKTRRKNLRAEILSVLEGIGEPMTSAAVADMVEGEVPSAKLALYHLNVLVDEGRVKRIADGGRHTFVAADLETAQDARIEPAEAIVPVTDFASALRAQMASLRAAIADGEAAVEARRREAEEAETQVKSLREKLAHMEALL